MKNWLNAARLRVARVTGDIMPVAQSSHLQHYEYDPNTQVLTIQFVNGSIYQYGNVPITKFEQMAQAGGAGTFFWQQIRDKYPTTMIVGPSKDPTRGKK